MKKSTEMVKKTTTSPKKIKLLEHQIKPLEYIISRCRKQHGLILNHYMGTGKTITGLVFLNNYPGKKKTLVIPEGFDNIWIQEAKNLKIMDMIKEVKILSYEDLALNFEKYEEYIKDSICVMDECHNIYDTIDYVTDGPRQQNKESKDNKKDKNVIVKPRLVDFINMMYSTEKILLLSGTLIKGSNLTDIRWLINIAVGKPEPIVSYSEPEFLLDVKKVTVVDKFYNQVFIPFLKINPFGLIPQDLKKKVPLDESNMVNFIYSIGITYILNNIKGDKKKDKKKDNNQKNTDISPLTVGSLNNNFLDILGYIPRIGKGYLFKRITETISKNDFLNSLKSREEMVKYLLFTIIGSIGLTIIFKYIKSFYEETYNFVRLDPVKLKKAGADKYFSYFNYLYSENNDYPKAKQVIKKVPYTQLQLILLFKMIGFPENLKSREYVELELNNTIEEADLFKDMYSVKNRSIYLNKGRIIGNLYEAPEKFKQILKMYIDSSKEQTVVYSNFLKSGVKLFSNFLRDNDVEHTVYSKTNSQEEKSKILKDFKKKKINLLILSPEFFEGVNILGCRNLHILEPMIRSDQKDQLYARVVRYKSHDHLEESKRNVTIYQWGCSIVYDINKPLQIKEYLTQWFRSKKEQETVLTLFKNFQEKLSPDDRLLNHYNKQNNFKKSFTKTIKYLSIDGSQIPLSCCIQTPDNSCSDKSLVKCNKKIL